MQQSQGLVKVEALEAALEGIGGRRPQHLPHQGLLRRHPIDHLRVAFLQQLLQPPGHGLPGAQVGRRPACRHHPGLHHRGQSRRVHGLGDEVIHPGLQAVLPVLFHGIGRHRHDGQAQALGQLPDGAGGAQSIHHGHLHVHQHQVVGLHTHQIQGLLSIQRHIHLEPLVAQQFAGDLQVHLVVVHCQDAAEGGPGGVRVPGGGRARLQPVGRVGQRFQRRLRLLGSRQSDREPESGALSQLAADTDLASHAFGELARDRQPQPRAPVAPAGGRVGLMKTLEQFCRLLRGEADAGVAHGKAQRHVIGFQMLHRHRHLDLALVRELDGVVPVVDEHLAHPQGVTHDEIGHVRRHVQHQLQPLGVGTFGDQVREVVQQRGNGEVDLLERELVGLDLGEVQDVVDDAQQVARGLLDLLQVVQQSSVLRAAQRQMRHADDGVHGCADLVAHVGQEVTLHARSVLGPLLGLAQLGFLGLQPFVRLGQIGCALQHPQFQRVVQLPVGLFGPLPLRDVAQDDGQQVFPLRAHARERGVCGKHLTVTAHAAHERGHPEEGRARLQTASLRRLAQVHRPVVLGQQLGQGPPDQIRWGVAEHHGPGRVDHADAVGVVHREDAVRGRLHHSRVAFGAGLQLLSRLLDARRHLIEVARQRGHFARPVHGHRCPHFAAGGELQTGLLQTCQWPGHAPPHQPGQRQHQHGRHRNLACQVL